MPPRRPAGLRPSLAWHGRLASSREHISALPASASPGECKMMSIVEKSRVVTMDKITALCKRRGFVFPGSDIYGGLANTWDYGPLGVELKRNVKDLWWRRFVHQRRDIVGLDAGILMHPRVWEASGHIE